MRLCDNQIKKMCGQDTSVFSWDRSLKKSDNGQQQASYQTGLPEIVQATSPSMEKTFEDLNNNNIFNPYSSEHNLEEAI